MEERKAWWFTFSDRDPACAWETEANARRLAAMAGTFIKVEVLGYPADPRLDDHVGWGGGQHPSLCMRPLLCARSDGSNGLCACPGGRSCSE
jgi:hypothetical protein